MTREDYEVLFSDGWRDPADDCGRLMVYFMAAIGFFAGIAMAAYGYWGLLHLDRFSHDLGPQSGRAEGLIFAFLCIGCGALMITGSGVFFRQEWRHMDLKRLTMERFVAGGFVFGFCLFLLGMEMMQGAAHAQKGGSSSPGSEMLPMVACFGAGIADLLFFLALGLVCAYLPKLRPTKRISEVTVDTRMAVDEKLNHIEDHPCPWEEGLDPVVRLRLKDGGRLWLRPTPSAYEFASPGAFGVATLKGNVLVRFEPKQRIGPPK